MNAFVVLNTIVHLLAFGIVIAGAYLILHGHGMAGGWTIAFGIVSFLFGGYKKKSR